MGAAARSAKQAVIVRRLESLREGQRVRLPAPRSGAVRAAGAQVAARQDALRKRLSLTGQARGLAEEVCHAALTDRRPSLRDAAACAFRLRSAFPGESPARVRGVDRAARTQDRAEALLLRLVTRWAERELTRQGDRDGETDAAQA